MQCHYEDSKKHKFYKILLPYSYIGVNMDLSDIDIAKCSRYILKIQNLSAALGIKVPKEYGLKYLDEDDTIPTYYLPLHKNTKIQVENVSKSDIKWMPGDVPIMPGDVILSESEGIIKLKNKSEFLENTGNHEIYGVIINDNKVITYIDSGYGTDLVTMENPNVINHIIKQDVSLSLGDSLYFFKTDKSFSPYMYRITLIDKKELLGIKNSATDTIKMR